MKISIIIPTYNEEESLEELTRDIVRSANDIDMLYEVIFVNDGSTDASRRKLEELARSTDTVKVINLRRNFGQTAAMMAGLDFASGDIIITMDGDLQNDPTDIAKLLKKMDEGYDVCSGWRKDRQDRLFTRILPSKIANWLISRISGVRLKDYGCTLKAYKRDVIRDIKLYGEMHRFIPICASWQGAKVTEIPVTHRARKYGTSKYGLERTFKVILDLFVIKFLSAYSQKPIYVFGGFGLVNFFLGFVAFCLMVYFKYFGQKSFIETPLPQLVILFFLMGFVSLLMGLIAEIQMRTYYESQNKTIYSVENTINMDKVF